MRKLKLTPKETVVLFQSLNMARDPSKGFTQEEAKKTRSLRENIEKYNESAENNIVSFPNGCELEVKEDEFETIKSKLKNSYGWNSPKDCDFVDDFLEKLRDIPICSDTEKLPKKAKNKT